MCLLTISVKNTPPEVVKLAKIAQNSGFSRLELVRARTFERKVLETRLYAQRMVPENADDNEFVEDFLRLVMENIQDRNISVVPTAPPIAKFIRRNRRYKSMLPVGVRI